MRSASLLTILHTASIATAAAQAPTIEPGRQARVTTPGAATQTIEGAYAGVRGDTLFLSITGASAPWAIAVTSVAKLEVRTKRPGVRGALIGAGIGAAGGALLGLGAEAFADANEPMAPVYGAVAGGLMGALAGRGGKTVALWSGVGFLGGALVGGAVGAVIQPSGDVSEKDVVLVGAGAVGLAGYAICTAIGFNRTRWMEIPSHSLRVAVLPRRHGVGLVGRLAF